MATSRQATVSRLALGGLALGAAKVNLDQSSSATVNAKDALDYEIEMVLSLKYVGQPKVGQSRSIPIFVGPIDQRRRGACGITRNLQASPGSRPSSPRRI